MFQPDNLPSMKQVLLLLIIPVILYGCAGKSNTQQTGIDTAKIYFPFKPKYSINWQMGDPKNALIVLNCLKSYVAGDIKGAMNAGLDTIYVNHLKLETEVKPTYIIHHLKELEDIF